MSSGWAGFWKDQDDEFDSIMQINTEYFASQLQDRFLMKAGMEILDYGCGPGLMANVFSRNHSFTGVDINESFIRQCRSKHPTAAFFKISEEPSVSQNIFDETIQGKQFDIVVVLSIIQYFQDLAHVEALLTLLKGYTKINGKVILADIIDDRTNSMADAASLLVHAIRKNKIGAFVKFIKYLMTSQYRDISTKKKLLTVSQQEIRRAGDKTGFSIEVAKGLTIHPSRTNYILTRRPD